MVMSPTNCRITGDCGEKKHMVIFINASVDMFDGGYLAEAIVAGLEVTPSALSLLQDGWPISEP